MPQESLQFYKEIAATNQWLSIYPELALGVLALALLVLDLFLPKRLRPMLPGWALLGQVLLLAVLLADFASGARLAALQGSTSFGGMLQHTLLGDAFRVFFLLSSIATTYVASVTFSKTDAPRTEYLHILLVATASLMLLAQSNHFVMLFVALETVTVCLYVLVSYFRNSALTLEAGLKYLIMGGLSSALLIFGIVLLYGAAGASEMIRSLPVPEPLSFDQIDEFIALNTSSPLVVAGVALVLAGVLFKIGAFPFQMWVPDVYQGAPTPTTGVLAVASKAAGFAVLLLLVSGPFAAMSDVLSTALAAIAAGSILFGNFAALTQRNVKRLIGLSGVSHAGFLLMGVSAYLALGRDNQAALSGPQQATLAAIGVYLVGYLFASTATLAVMAHVARGDDADQELDHYEDLSRRQPFLAGVLAIGVGSLAGIPPTVGFIGKALLFIAAFKAGLYWLLAVAALGVAVSIYYYFGWIKAAWFDTWKLPAAPGEEQSAPPVTAPSLGGRMILFAVCAVTLVFGVVQFPLTRSLLGW
jgi:NADH-quinone oxidoreductase subunit N